MWFELGEDVRLRLVKDEEEEEEDLEVKAIFNEAKNKHRRIMAGMYTM